MDDDDPCPIYSVDKDSSDAYDPATSAQVKVTGADVDVEFVDSICCYGVYFEMVDGDLDASSTGYFHFEDCTFLFSAPAITRIFNLSSSSASSKSINCTFNNASGSVGYYMNCGYPAQTFRGCSFSGFSSTSYFVNASLGSAHEASVTFEGCDFSGLTNVTNLNSTASSARFIDCKFATGDTVGGLTAAGTQLLVRNYGSAIDGAGTAKNYIAEHHFQAGTVIQDTAIYRDDGWQDEDGDTRLSHKMTPDSDMKGAHTPIFGPDLRAYVDSTGSKTFTVYAAQDFTAAPTADEAWIEVMYLGTANSVLWSHGGGREILGSTALTTDTKAWTWGNGAKNRIKFSETLTVNKTGTYVIRVFLGKYELGKGLWYCPLVEIS